MENRLCKLYLRSDWTFSLSSSGTTPDLNNELASFQGASENSGVTDRNWFRLDRCSPVLAVEQMGLAHVDAACST